MEQQSWQRVEVLQVLGGVILGLLGGWFLFALATLVMYASYGDTGAQLGQALVGVATLLVIPLVAGVVLIRRGRGVRAGPVPPDASTVRVSRRVPPARGPGCPAGGRRR